MVEQNNHTRNNQRVQLDHLLLDRDFFRKPKILLFTTRFGAAATLWLTDLLGVLSGATDAEIETDVAYCTATMFGVQNAKEALEYLLEQSILIVPRVGYISNVRVAQDQESCAVKRERWRNQKRNQRGQLEGQVRVQASGPLNTEILNTEDLDLKNKGEDSEPTEPNPLLAFAESQLLPKDHPTTLNSNLYLTQGKRRIKKYPNLWLTAPQLANAIKIIEEMGVPRKKIGLVFEAANSSAERALNSGKSLELIDAYNLITTYKLTEVLKTLKESTDLKRSETYLQEARR